jgi:hypothetical protein
MENLHPDNKADFKGFIKLHYKTLGDLNSKELKNQYINDHPGLITILRVFKNYRNEHRLVVSKICWIFSLYSAEYSLELLSSLNCLDPFNLWLLFCVAISLVCWFFFKKKCIPIRIKVICAKAEVNESLHINMILLTSK